MAAFTEGAGNIRELEGKRTLMFWGVCPEDEERGGLIEETTLVRPVVCLTHSQRYPRTSNNWPRQACGKRPNRKLPMDYQYDNAKPSEELKANTIFGLAAELDEEFRNDWIAYLLRKLGRF